MVDPKGPKEVPKGPMVNPEGPKENPKRPQGGPWGSLVSLQQIARFATARFGHQKRFKGHQTISVRRDLENGTVPYTYEMGPECDFELNPRRILMDRLNDSLCIAFRRGHSRIVIVYRRLIMCQNTSGTTLWVIGGPGLPGHQLISIKGIQGDQNGHQNRARGPECNDIDLL